MAASYTLNNSVRKSTRFKDPFDKYVFQKKMDAYNTDTFIKENLKFPVEYKSHSIANDPQFGMLSLDQTYDIYDQPRTLIH
jgi:hypothetical protein